MTRMKAYGTHKTVFVLTLSDVSAPTAVELNDASALDFGKLAARDDSQLGVTGQADINDSQYGSEADDTVGGLLTIGAGFKFYRHEEDAEDIAANVFDAGETVQGFLVRRISAKKQEPFATGDKVTVLKVESNEPIDDAPAGGLQKFMVKFNVLSADSDLHAVVA